MTEPELIVPGNSKEQKALEIIDFARGNVMDCLQVHYEDLPSYKLVRATILKIFGNKGLERKIIELMRGTDKYEHGSPETD